MVRQRQSRIFDFKSNRKKNNVGGIPSGIFLMFLNFGLISDLVVIVHDLNEPLIKD